MTVYRCFTEKKTGYDIEATGLCHDLREFLGIHGLDAVRIFNRYDTEGIARAVYDKARFTVFAEPQVDALYDETMPEFDEAHWSLGVEALPGQFDQRADSCASCIQILTCLDRPAVKAAKFYVFFGQLTAADRIRLRAYLINPVETREASAEKPPSLAQKYPAPPPVGLVDGFIAADDDALRGLLDTLGLAMDLDDLRFMQAYFRDTEKRDPTVTEVRVIDTYWSDHCRHTTFHTQLDRVGIEDSAVSAAYGRYLDARREVYGDAADARPQTLMDIATIGAKVLRKRGLLQNLDISEEVNACSIHVGVTVGGASGPGGACAATEDWLLMFKNETHNHPTEIEPFGGAATCIGGAIRDPLSGRAYVYQAMRLTGAGDPRVPIGDTLPGKLPQRKLTVSAAQGYSSYGNQIGLATGLVHEVYHPGFVAKRMEIGAVVGAVKAENVVRETPSPGDKVILLGGRTGRDGIGGATGSSKTHNDLSLVTMASEVQKGNAPEERKIQRLFSIPEVTGMIKRCNDFGAGGVSVAIGELADGLDIDLTLVRKKYEGLDATELAISESQERMAVVVAPENAGAFIDRAAGENLEAYTVAEVTASPRMVMRYQGDVVADLSRDFLSSNGAPKHAEAAVPPLGRTGNTTVAAGALGDRLRAMAGDLRFCSRRGLIERFDSSIGAGSVLMPFGGKYQKTPVQVMAALLPVPDGATTTCSVMSFGFDPYLAAENPFEGARTAVISSVSKLVAAGCDHERAYLTFQEYFERLRREPLRWGKPLAALLGALEAQLGLELAAIGGKDSMSGSFNDLDVPPSLISFAIAPNDAAHVISPEFKTPGNRVVLFEVGASLPETTKLWKRIRALITEGVIVSAWSVGEGGAAEGLFKMALGNRLGFDADVSLGADSLFCTPVGAIIAEVTGDLKVTGDINVAGDSSITSLVPEARALGRVTDRYEMCVAGETVALDALERLWDGCLESVFPTKAGSPEHAEPVSGDHLTEQVSGELRFKPLSYMARSAATPPERFSKPRALITAFPGTNCENDTARAVKKAGGCPEIRLIRNLSPALLEDSVLAVEKSIRESQLIILPGGFSGGDEPDGSAKFITAFFRNPRITDAVHDLLHRRGGLMLGICNGFQALIKLGLVPYGEIRPPEADSPTLTFNQIGRHQAKYVTTRIASVKSPWLDLCQVGDVHALPVSHGEGRFICPGDILASLVKNGQIATQYCDLSGAASQDILYNPNGSVLAVEGISSPDGRVYGKMCHPERVGDFTARNIHGDRVQPVFESGVKYFT
jgi:phosphoribosylformylglycinamidine synthase